MSRSSKEIEAEIERLTEELDVVRQQENTVSRPEDLDLLRAETWAVLPWNTNFLEAKTCNLRVRELAARYVRIELREDAWIRLNKTKATVHLSIEKAGVREGVYAALNDATLSMLVREGFKLAVHEECREAVEAAKEELAAAEADLAKQQDKIERVVKLAQETP